MNTITWDEKVKMSRLKNRGEDSEVVQFVCENVDRLDDVGWELAIGCLNISEENVEQHLEKFEVIVGKFHKIMQEERAKRISMQALFRAGYMKGTVEKVREEKTKKE